MEKTFVLHVQGGARLPVLRGVSLAVGAGECVVLADPSGSGKSTLLRSVYGNYKPQAGEILVRHGAETVDMVSAPPRRVLDVRRRTVGYVSQFLRVVPRVPAEDVVRSRCARWGRSVKRRGAGRAPCSIGCASRSACGRSRR